MATNADPELLTKLWRDTRVPPPEMVQTIDKGKFKADAVGHADVTEIILDHDPEWELEAAGVDEHGTPVITKDPDGNLVFWAYLTIHGKRRLCVGTCKPGAPDIMKELLGDAIRNGAMRFGVAITLWSKTERAQTSSTGSSTSTARAESRGGAAGRTGPAAPSGEEPKWQKVLAIVKQQRSTDEELAQFRAWLEEKKIPNDFAKMSDAQLNEVLAEVDPL